MPSLSLTRVENKFYKRNILFPQATDGRIFIFERRVAKDNTAKEKVELKKLRIRAHQLGQKMLTERPLKAGTLKHGTSYQCSKIQGLFSASSFKFPTQLVPDFVRDAAAFESEYLALFNIAPAPHLQKAWGQGNEVMVPIIF